MATENDEDMEYLLEEYIQTKGQIESGKKELTLNEVKYISMFNHVREILFQSLGSEDLITGAISNFDETGNYLGLPREIQEILENRRIDVDAILIVSRSGSPMLNFIRSKLGAPWDYGTYYAKFDKDQNCTTSSSFWDYTTFFRRFRIPLSSSLLLHVAKETIKLNLTEIKFNSGNGNENCKIILLKIGHEKIASPFFPRSYLNCTLTCYLSINF